MAGSEELTASAILERFTQPHWDERVPQLDEAAQQIILDHFEQNEIGFVAGSLPVREAVNSSLGTILSFNGHAKAELVNFRDTLVGPYFLGGTYYPEGVAIWGLKNRKGQSIHSK